MLFYDSNFDSFLLIISVFVFDSRLCSNCLVINDQVIIFPKNGKR